jgi:hypothetical protein
MRALVTIGKIGKRVQRKSEWLVDSEWEGDRG